MQLNANRFLEGRTLGWGQKIPKVRERVESGHPSHNRAHTHGYLPSSAKDSSHRHNDVPPRKEFVCIRLQQVAAGPKPSNYRRDPYFGRTWLATWREA